MIDPETLQRIQDLLGPPANPPQQQPASMAANIPTQVQPNRSLGRPNMPPPAPYTPPEFEQADRLQAQAFAPPPPPSDNPWKRILGAGVKALQGSAYPGGVAQMDAIQAKEDDANRERLLDTVRSLRGQGNANRQAEMQYRKGVYDQSRDVLADEQQDFENEQTRRNFGLNTERVDLERRRLDQAIESDKRDTERQSMLDARNPDEELQTDKGTFLWNAEKRAYELKPELGKKQMSASSGDPFEVRTIVKNGRKIDEYRLKTNPSQVVFSQDAGPAPPPGEPGAYTVFVDPRTGQPIAAWNAKSGGFKEAPSGLEGTAKAAEPAARVLIAENAASGLRALDVLTSEIGKSSWALLKADLPGSPGARVLETSRKEISDIITRLRTGAALNESEEAFYRGQLPNAFDSEATIKYKLQLFRDLFTRMAGISQGTAAPHQNGPRGGGTNVPRGTAAPAASSNAVEWERGPDGVPRPKRK